MEESEDETIYLGGSVVLTKETNSYTASNLANSAFYSAYIAQYIGDQIGMTTSYHFSIGE